MEFEFIYTDSLFLKDVMKLGKKNSSTLGFLPEGGFLEHAKKRQILIATDDGVLCGYILFRISLRTNILSITHLCVDSKFRGKKVSVQLLDKLREKYQNLLSGILLSCRKDYVHPSKLWHSYGFQPKDEVRSRSQEVNFLVKWWYGFNQKDLFSFNQDTNKHSVLLDMNILIKLRDNSKKSNIEVEPLLADWLVSEVEYFFAGEFYNEIRRDNNRERYNKTKVFVESNFNEAKIDKEESKKINETIKHLFKSDKANDFSDINQVSDCISAGIKYFITLDRDILNAKFQIEELHDITILSPSELILQIDMLKNDTNYHPYRLSGAMHTSKQIDSDSLKTYLDKFKMKNHGETKVIFEKKMLSVLKQMPFAHINTVEDKDKKPIAFWGYTLKNNSLNIEFIRTISDALEMTLFTQLIFEIINKSIFENKNIIEIKDDFFCVNKLGILNDFGFIKLDNVLKKAAISDLILSSDLIRKYPFVKEFFDGLEEIINEKNTEQKKYNLYKIERALYPLKFEDLDIPCYIVPIKRYWAGQLFDKYNTNQDMFGANPHKIWNRENVYYRSIKPINEKFPARILWYVSVQKHFNRQRSILATSYLDNVSIDNVKEQFRKFKKYGIYEWSNIYELAGSDSNKNIKAIQFSDTEVFREEVDFDKITFVLQKNNQKKNTFASPVKISIAVFNDIYKLALNKNV